MAARAVDAIAASRPVHSCHTGDELTTIGFMELSDMSHVAQLHETDRRQLIPREQCSARHAGPGASTARV